VRRFFHIRHLAGKNSRKVFLFLSTVIVVVVSAQSVPTSDAAWTSVLPDSLGEYARINVSPGPISASRHELLDEYGLKATERASYVNASGRRMDAEALRFGDSEGGHAAYLCLRPRAAVGSPLSSYSDRSGVFGQTYAVLGGGVTVVERKNYVFRFRGDAPTHEVLGNLLNHLPGLDAAEPSKGECCRYFDESSERILLGPVSLAKFAARVPPPVAAFQMGGRGRVARFETPAGSMSKIVFAYSSPAVAWDRYNAFRSLPGARVRLANRKVGVIFYPSDGREAGALLEDIAYDGIAEPESISFDPGFIDGDLTLDDAMASTFAGSVLGCLIAVLRRMARWRQGIPDRTISLHLGNGQL
jgi:hypothetical protein